MMKLSADFWRHVLIGAAGAGATAVLGNLAHVDWSSFGAYATMIQLGIQVATEGLNQALAAGK